MSHRRLIAIATPAVLFVVTGAFIAALLLGHSATEPLGSALGIGTLSSLFATLIASLVRVVTAAQPDSSSAGNAFPGLLRISAKNELTSDDWLQVLRTAKTEFYIAGHSLGKWCSATNRDEFKDHVERVLSNNGRVTLVMLAPDSAQIGLLQRATSVDYTGRIETSLSVLAELHARLQHGACDRLQISVLAD